MIKHLLLPLLLATALCWGCQSTTTKKEPPAMEPEPATVTLVHNMKPQLGEGAIWDQQQQAFYYVDIEGQLLYRWQPGQAQPATFNLGQRVGTVVPEGNGTSVVVALQDGIYRMQLANGQLEPIANPEAGLADNRFNDGKCDPAGRLWVGSMHLRQLPGAAALYKVAPDGTHQKMVDSVTISNGICWAANGKTMYYIDTPTQQVKAFDYDVATGNITNGRVAVQVADSLGHPDGMAIDAEGMLWVALWGGHAVSRWNPNTGQLLQLVDVPALNVTSVAFAGDSLATMYITSASIGMTPEQEAQYPEAGGLFQYQPGVKGQNTHYFGLPTEVK